MITARPRPKATRFAAVFIIWVLCHLNPSKNRLCLPLIRRGLRLCVRAENQVKIPSRREVENPDPRCLLSYCLTTTRAIRENRETLGFGRDVASKFINSLELSSVRIEISKEGILGNRPTSLLNVHALTNARLHAKV